MTTSEGPAGFEEVYETELDEILTRRRVVGLSNGANANDAPRRAVSKELVGLALSGGGVRSAGFNLGLLQALYRKGVLRHVDFLSTVSGGGYVGSYLSSLAVRYGERFNQVANAQHGSDNAGNGEQSTPGERFPLDQQADGTQPPSVRGLIYAGRQLRKPLVFFNRYFIGLVLINLVLLSGVIAACAGVAYLFRSLDHPEVRWWLGGLGFRGDVLLALFPAFVFLAAWLGAWMISYFRKGAAGLGRAARPLLVGTTVSFLVALAALVGTGDVSFALLKDWWGFEPATKTVEGIRSDVKLAFLVVLAIALLPYLRVKDLLRSGTRPQRTWEKWTFAVASRALLYGFPLLLIGLFTRENISGFNENRGGERYELTRTDLGSPDGWDQFWRRVERESGKPSAVHPNLSKMLWSPAIRRLVGEYRTLRIKTKRYEEKASFAGRWWSLCHYLATGAGTLSDYVTHQRRIYEIRGDVCAQLNADVLAKGEMIEGLKWIAPEWVRSLGGEDAAERERLNRLRALHEQGRQLAQRKDPEATVAEWQELNWNILKTYYADPLRDKSTVLSYVVLDADQATRLAWLGWSALVFFLSALVVNLNATSMHGFYRNRLAEMWIDAPDSKRRIPLRRLDTTSHGAPYHLLAATLNVFGRKRDKEKSPFEQFVFSKRFCGSDRTGYKATERFMRGDYDLADAMAISGAAVSPARLTNPLLAALLLVTNFRLGQWLENPGHRRSYGRWLHDLAARFPATPARVLSGLLAQTATQRNLCFVTDGGHHENLGIEPLLERRCRVIIASDVSLDSEYAFRDFMKLRRRMRVLCGTKMYTGDGQSVSLDPLVPHPTTLLSDRHYCVIRVRYPDPVEGASVNGHKAPGASEGLLVYVKPSYTGDEPSDLMQYRSENESFPHDSTADQFYEPRKFESYRQLGYHVGETLCADLWERIEGGLGGAEPRLARWTPDEFPPAARQGAAGVAEEVDAEGGVEAEEQIETFPTTVDAETLPVLVRALAGANAELRHLAAHVLGEFGPAASAAQRNRAADALLGVVSDTHLDATAREKPVWALGEVAARFGPRSKRLQQARVCLAGIVQDGCEPKQLRAAALEALVATGESLQTRELLERLQEDADRELALIARWGLARMG